MTRYKFLMILICLISLLSLANAESIYSKNYDFYLDIPEGYHTEQLVKNGQIFLKNDVPVLIQHDILPVSLILKPCTQKKYKSAENALTENLKSLQAEYEYSDFNWNDTTCYFSQFKMSAGEGFALCVPLQDNNFLFLICFASSDSFDACFNFICSTINSLSVGFENYNKPGPFISFYHPREKEKKINFTIDNNLIDGSIDEVDEEAAQFIVDLEFYVLTLYVQHPLVFDAWSRFYRMIYRDSFGRLENCMQNANDKIYADAIFSSKNPELKYAQTILSWVQNFDYKRDNEKASDSDFTNLVSCITGKGCDCDSRSLLVSMFLRSAGLESFIIYSPDYSHAMTTVYLDAPGQSFSIQLSDGSTKDYLMGETTDKVTWGMIPQQMADRSKWHPAILP